MHETLLQALLALYAHLLQVCISLINVRNFDRMLNVLEPQWGNITYSAEIPPEELLSPVAATRLCHSNCGPFVGPFSHTHYVCTFGGCEKKPRWGIPFLYPAWGERFWQAGITEYQLWQMVYLVYKFTGQMEESHYSTPVDAISKDVSCNCHEDILNAVPLNLVYQSDGRKWTHSNMRMIWLNWFTDPNSSC